MLKRVQHNKYQGACPVQTCPMHSCFQYDTKLYYLDTRQREAAHTARAHDNSVLAASSILSRQWRLWLSKLIWSTHTQPS